jgi:amidase
VAERGRAAGRTPGELTVGSPAAAHQESVCRLGVVELAEAMAAGALRCTDVVDALLARTARLDPALRCYRLLLADRARAEAAAADRARTAGDQRPLLGLPVAVKDTVALAGTPTSHGTGSAEPVAAADGPTVRRLRAAGAVVVGKTELPELALWAVTARRNAAPTRNPWRLDRTPGGSSGGSAAAVAARLVPAATGTDGLGSIRIPAAWTGVVGLKPSQGLVPPDVPDHWQGLSHAGVLTRSVLDTAVLLDVLRVDGAGGAAPGSLAAAARTEVGPLRVGWSLRGITPGVRVHRDVRAAVRETLRAIAELGLPVRRLDPPLVETAHLVLPRYLAGVAEDFARLADPAGTERRTRTMARAGRRMPAAAVRRARRDSAALSRRLAEQVFGAVDVLVQPTTAVPPLDAAALVRRGAVGTVLGFSRAVPFTQLWNLTGFPAVSLPVGRTGDGLPVGVQLAGPPGADARLLSLAAALERRFGWPERVPPLP